MNSYVMLILSTLISILIVFLQSQSVSKIRNAECSILEVISHFIALISLFTHALFGLNLIVPIMLFCFIIFVTKEKNSQEIKESVSTIAVILGSYAAMKYIDSIYMKILFVIILNYSVEILLHYKKYKVSLIRLLYSFIIISSTDQRETIISFIIISIFELILYKVLKRTMPLSFRSINKLNTRFLQLSLLALIIGVYLK